MGDLLQKTQAAPAIRWLPCKNGSGSLTIPPSGCVVVTDADPASGVMTVDQPSASGQLLMFNGASPIPPGGFGAVTADCPVFALYDSGTGAPAPGDIWGSQSGSYMLANGNPGYQVLGGAGAGPPAKALVLPTGGSGAVIRFVRLTGLPGQDCTSLYLDGYLQAASFTGAEPGGSGAGSGDCALITDGQRVDVIDFNNLPPGTGSGSGA